MWEREAFSFSLPTSCPGPPSRWPGLSQGKLRSQWTEQPSPQAGAVQIEDVQGALAGERQAVGLRSDCGWDHSFIQQIHSITLGLLTKCGWV